MKTSFRNCIAGLAFLLAAFSAEAVRPGGMAPGPHEVGFRVAQQYDYTRIFKPRTDAVTGAPVQGERARPMQMLVWYPAAGPSPRRARYADYARTRLTEQTFGATATDIPAQARVAADSPMLAWVDARPAAGRFPLVVYAPGAGGWADENADLCEYLASHGYVVVAGPGLGTRAKRSAYTLEDAETGARDVEFVLGQALSMPQVDATRIAALGWSWGGMANVLAAARDDRITAIVSLDGTREPAFTKSIEPRTLTAPWLYVSRTSDTIPQINRAEIDTTFSLLNAARFSDVYQLTMYPMRHVDFVSRHLRESGAADFDEYSQAEVADAFGSVALYVLRFLDAYLKADASGAAFLRRTPRENGVAVHSMRVDVHAAEALPPPK